MTNLFKRGSTITDIEKVLTEYCVQPEDGSCILPVKTIPVTEEDLDLMLKYIRSYMNYTGDVSAYYNIRLTILMTWIFSDRRSHRDFAKTFEANMAKIPQHHYRYYLELLTSTIYDYNLETFGETFGENFEKEEGICKIIHMHANI